MPRIPDYDAAGTSVARTNTPRFNDRSSEIREQGAQALLGSVNKVMGRVVEHDDQLRYAAARSTLLREQMAARKELETDPDHATFEPRFRERMAKAQGQAGALIRGGRSRALFEAQAQDDLERGVAQVQALARGVEVRQGIAALNDTLEVNRNAALESTDPEERGRLLTASYEAIRGAVGPRYIDEAQAGDITTKYRSNFSEAFVGIQSPAERIEMLSNPGANLAKHIAPDRRHALLEAAKRENHQVRVMGESQAFDDDFEREYGNDFGAALRAAKAIKDPEVRAATETRTKQRLVLAKQFDIEDREEAGESAMQFILEGGKYADLPITLKARLKPAALNSLRNLAETGGRTVSDARTLQELEGLSGEDPQKFADDVDMMDYRHLLTPGDYKGFLTEQKKIRSGEGEGKAAGYQSIAQARDATLLELFKATSAKGEAQVPISDFITKFDRRKKAFKADTGKEPRIDDARAILEEMKVEVVTKEGWISDSKKRAYQLTDEETQVPQKDREQAIAALKARGHPVTVKEIRRMFEANRARRIFEKPKPDAPAP